MIVEFLTFKFHFFILNFEGEAVDNINIMKNLDSNQN